MKPKHRDLFMEIMAQGVIPLIFVVVGLSFDMFGIFVLGLVIFAVAVSFDKEFWLKTFLLKKDREIFIPKMKSTDD